jgi:hypothetical protein
MIARARLAAALVLLIVVGSGCGGDGAAATNGTSVPAAQHRAYRAAAEAFRTGDYDAALSGYRKAGGYSDAALRVKRVLHVAAVRTLANARRKLLFGHPRAALAQAQTATRRYGARTPAALKLVKISGEAQSIFHHCQADHPEPYCLRLAHRYARQRY